MSQTRFGVSDERPGMSPEQLSGLFRPVVQAEAGTARRYGGRGLGLSIYRKPASMMGGEIAADSTPGKGSTFRVWPPLPAWEPQDQGDEADHGPDMPVMDGVEAVGRIRDGQAGRRGDGAPMEAA